MSERSHTRPPGAPDARKTPSREDYDAVVIGSGAGGLCAALGLARGGMRVLVCEARSSIGGYLNPFRRGKYRFDPGVHYLTDCEPGGRFEALLRELGVRVPFVEMDPEGFLRLDVPGYSVALPRGAERYRERLEGLFPHEREGLRGFFALLAEFFALWKTADAADLLASTTSAPSLVRTFSSATRVLRRTYSEVLDQYVRDPALRTLLSGQVGDYGVPPGRAAAPVALGTLAQVLAGTWRVEGGAGVLRDALVSTLRAHGGEVIADAPVARVLCEGGRVRGVELASGVRVRAPRVVSNADPLWTLARVEGRPAASSPASRARYTPSAVMLFLALDEPPERHGLREPLRGNFPASAIDPLFEPVWNGRPSKPGEELVWLSHARAPEAGPDSHALQAVMAYPYGPFAPWAAQRALQRDEAYAAAKEQAVSAFRARLGALFPGLLARARELDAATPLSFEWYAGSPQGALYGLAYTPEQGLFERFGVRTRVRGLYLCGASTWGPGVLRAAQSGVAAAREALR